MIKSFYIENYKSWKEPVLIDFSATSISEHNENTFLTRKGKLLKNIAIYGANASGKSNLLDAIAYMAGKVLELENPKILHNMFKSEDNAFLQQQFFKKQVCETYAYNKKPSTFEICFIVDNKEYSYGFKVHNDIIKEEWFDVNGKTYFERNKTSKELLPFKFILEKVPSNALYLTYLLEYSKLKKIDPMWKLFMQFKYISVIKDLDKLSETFVNSFIVDMLLKNKRYFEKLKDFFEIVDFGIKDIYRDKNTNNIFVTHIGENKTFDLPLGKESDGTKKMFLILVSLFIKLDLGGLIIADEFTASLHPLLSKAVLDIISDETQNKNNAQIIFSTHDVFLMSKEQFRRDEILFVSKDNRGISELNRLYDFKDEADNRVRNDVVYYKNYLRGMYAGTPNIDYYRLTDCRENIVAETPSKYKT